jgi:type II secretory pathway pseudopilin PulG
MKWKSKISNKQSGLTYVELIVVISIFLLLSVVSLGNYRAFQDRVNIKNLASDIALILTQAQNDAITGRIAPAGFTPISGWKPSYGVYFDVLTPTEIIYFIDKDNDYVFDADETIDTLSITKGNFIKNEPEGLKAADQSSSECPNTTTDATVVYKRPDSRPVITSGQNDPQTECSVHFLDINVSSASGEEGKIVVEGTGRIYIE